VARKTKHFRRAHAAKRTAPRAGRPKRKSDRPGRARTNGATKLKKVRVGEKAKEQARRQREQQGSRLAGEQGLVHRFPKLKKPIAYGSTIYDRAEEIPLDEMSRTDWWRLGCLVTAQHPRSYFVTNGGAQVVPLFSGDQVAEIPRRRNWTAERLWDEYQARGLTLAHAIWAANRLAKLFPAYKADVYLIKDRFLQSHQDHLIEARCVRTEASPCWSCNGCTRWCRRCGGTGTCSTRVLYEHILEFDGEVYSFHSYVKPRRLSETAGADLPAYGRRLTPRDTIPYHIDEYLWMLGHLAGSWR
jgi:hypothetical protein